MPDPGRIFEERLGEAWEKFFLGSKEHRQKLPEGEVSASLSAASAFLAGVGFLFALPTDLNAAFIGPVPGMSAGATLAVATAGLVASYIG